MHGKYVVTALLVGGLLNGGCRSIPIPYGVRDTSAVEEGFLNPPETGVEYCRRLARTADHKGQIFLGLGIAMGIVAAGAAVAGAAMGPDTSADANWAAKNRNALVVASGGILGIPTTILLMRSKDASNASGAASSAIGKEDGAAMDACLKARADWANARGAAADAAQQKLSDKIKEREDAIKNEEAEKKKNEDTAATTTDPATRADALRKANESAARINTLNDEIRRLIAPTSRPVLAPPQPIVPVAPQPVPPP